MSGLEPSDGTVSSEHLGVRVWAVHGVSLQEMMDRVAVILGEHLQEDDELHVSYNAMPSGYQQHSGARVIGPAKPYTELFFEYSALLVLRGRTPSVELSWPDGQER